MIICEVAVYKEVAIAVGLKSQNLTSYKQTTEIVIYVFNLSSSLSVLASTVCRIPRVV